MTGKVATRAPLAARLWEYQAERFPVGRTAALVAVFAASGVSLSSVLGGRALPGIGFYLGAFVVTFGLFLQLRAADEVKDADDDDRFRPERPIPRGLVSLRLIVGLGVAAAVVQAAVAWLLALGLVVLLGVVWAWLGLMSAEFFVPTWLRARPVLYLVSHMAIMPLIDLWITGVDWVPRGGVPPAGLVPALLLSVVNGCVLEVGRKTWAEERPGVETYSALWGVRPAVRVWLGLLGAAAVLAVVTGGLAGAPWPVAAVVAVALAWGARAGLAFHARPDAAGQKRLDTAAGVWVLASYAALGLLPAVLR